MWHASVITFTEFLAKFKSKVEIVRTYRAAPTQLRYAVLQVRRILFFENIGRRGVVDSAFKSVDVYRC